MAGTGSLGIGSVAGLAPITSLAPPAAHRTKARRDVPVDDQAVLAWLIASKGVIAAQRRVLKASTGRPVVQYRYVDPDRPGAPRRASVVAKGYHRGDGAATFAAMADLWSGGFADDPRFTIPQPYAYLAEPRLLLQATAAGPSLYRFIDDPSAGLGAVRLTGRWLAKLHTTPEPEWPPLDAQREAERLATFHHALVAACPALAQRLSALVDEVARQEGTSSPTAPVSTHGDFQPKNVHIARRRVTVIDFDRFAAARPARDLGHFVAQSTTMSFVRTASFRPIEAWVAAFLDEYAAAGPAHWEVGLPAATVRSMLEILYYKLVVRPVRDAWFVTDWLDECERCLRSPVPGVQ